MWREVMRHWSRGMVRQDKVTFGVYAALLVSLHRCRADGDESGDYSGYRRMQEVIDVFLGMSKMPYKGQVAYSRPLPHDGNASRPVPDDGKASHGKALYGKPWWLGSVAYAHVVQLSSLSSDYSTSGSPLRNLLPQLHEFKVLVESGDGNVPWPQGWEQDLSPLEKWVTLQSLRPDLAVAASMRFVREVLGCSDGLDEQVVTLNILAGIPRNRPMLFLLSSPVLLTDLVALVEAAEGKCVPVVCLADDGPDQGCQDLIEKAYSEGSGIMIEGAHRCPNWVNSVLDPLMDRMLQHDRLLQHETLPHSNFTLMLLVPLMQIDRDHNGSIPWPVHWHKAPEGLTGDIMRQCSSVMWAHPAEARPDFVYNLRALTFFCDVELDHITKSLRSSLDPGAAQPKTDVEVRGLMLRPLLFAMSLLHCGMRSKVLSGAFNNYPRIQHGVADLSSALCIALLMWGHDKYQDETSQDETSRHQTSPDHASARDGTHLPWALFRSVLSQMTLRPLLTDAWEHRIFSLLLHRSLPWHTPLRSTSTPSTGKVDFEAIGALATEPLDFLSMEQRLLEMYVCASSPHLCVCVLCTHMFLAYVFASCRYV